MPTGMLKAKQTLSNSYPAGDSTGRYVIFGASQSGVGTLIVDVADILTATNEIVINDQISDANKKYALGTRVTFPTVNFVSDPQIVVGEILYVIEAGANNIKLSKTPYDPENVPTEISFTSAGTASSSIRDLNTQETLGGNTSSVYTVADMRRYELSLGVSINRSSWAANPIILGKQSSSNPNATQTDRAIMSLAQMGDNTPAGEGVVEPPGDVSYGAIAFIEPHPGSGLDPDFTAASSATPFDPGGIVTAIYETSSTLLGGGATSIRAEITG